MSMSTAEQFIFRNSSTDDRTSITDKWISAEDKCVYPKIPVTVTSGDDSGEAASDRKHATKVLIRNNVMHGFCVSILPQIEQDNHVYVR